MSGHTYIRASKYRHVYGVDPKPDTVFSNYRALNSFSESNSIKASAIFFITPLDGSGGPLAVVPLDKPGRFNTETPILHTHSGALLDFDFSPFHDNIFATCSEDTTVKVWYVPEGGLVKEQEIEGSYEGKNSNLTKPLVELRGHTKKVGTLRFHPTAGHILASSGAEQSIKLWDVCKGSLMSSLDNLHAQPVTDMTWDYSGATLATSCKDKSLRFIDPRAGTIAGTVETAHEGSKSMKILFLGESGNLLSTGFSKLAKRQVKIWDPRNTSVEIFKLDIDNSSGTLMPFYDPDSSILYLAGKGDGNIRYYEVVSNVCHPIADYKSSVPTKGMAIVPKRGLNIGACETARLMKLTASNSIDPISFIVPRKSESFQDDIFPDTIGTSPALTAEEWFVGENRSPKLIALDPRSGSKKINTACIQVSSSKVAPKSPIARVPEDPVVAVPAPLAEESSEEAHQEQEEVPYVEAEDADISPEERPHATPTGDELQDARNKIKELEALLEQKTNWAIAVNRKAQNTIQELENDKKEAYVRIEELEDLVVRMTEEQQASRARETQLQEDRDSAAPPVVSVSTATTTPAVPTGESESSATSKSVEAERLERLLVSQELALLRIEQIEKRLSTEILSPIKLEALLRHEQGQHEAAAVESAESVGDVGGEKDDEVTTTADVEVAVESTVLPVVVPGEGEEAKAVGAGREVVSEEDDEEGGGGTAEYNI